MTVPLSTVVDITINVAGSQGPKFGFGSLLGAFTHSVTANRQDGPYFSIKEVEDAGFTAAAVPALHEWATIAFTQTRGVDSVIIGRVDAGDANWTATMTAIEAEDPNSWYWTNIESRADADIAEVAAWVEARFYRYSGQSDDKTGVAMAAAKAAGYKRTFLSYHATDGDYLDGGITSIIGGFNLDVPDGVGVAFGKAPIGITPDILTDGESTAIFAENGNVYTTTNQPFYTKGTNADGSFIDVQTTVDWLDKRIQEAVIAAFVNTPTKIPYTQRGIHTIVTTVLGVLNDGVSFGHFAPNPAPECIEPDILTISAADKENRNLTLTATATLAGAIQKLTITFNLTL
jgi:hypothetical protein